MNKLKELRLIVKMNDKLGVVTEQSIYDQIAAEQLKEDRQLAMQEERKTAFKSLFTDLAKDINKLVAEDKKKTEEEQALLDRFTNVLEHIESIKPGSDEPQVTITEEVVEDQQFDELVEKSAILAPPETLTLAAAAAKRLADTSAPSMFVQPDPAPTGRDLQAIQNKLKLLEGWVSKISMSGPGGGEVLFRYLDDVNRHTMTESNDNWVLEYDGATKKVQFTENIGPIRTIKMNVAGPQTPLVPGQLGWNVEEDCLDIRHADGSTLQAGFEHYFQIHNSTGSTLLNGEVVMFAGVDEESHTNPIVQVAKYVAGPLATPLYLVGVMTNDVEDGGHGRATAFGKVRNLNTTGSSVGESWAKGDLLWAHPTMAGKLTKVRPTSPNVATSVAAVLQVNAATGILLVRPTIWPRLFYGDWFDTTNQTAAAANTAYPVIVSRGGAGAVSGFEVNAGGTVVKALNAGRYNFEFSIQLSSTNSALARVWIWYRKNGVDVPNSTTVVTVRENGGKLAPSWNFPVLMELNDTFTLMWATESTNIFLSAEPATAFCPAIPSVILTVSQTNL